MNFHDAIDHGLTALMPSRAARMRVVTGGAYDGAIALGVAGAALLAGGVGTVLVGGAMQMAGKPSGVTVTRVGAVMTLPPVILFGGLALKAHFAARPALATAPGAKP
jgi:hypothetical protein